MPIMAANGQSDARGAAWLLATTAKSCMENPHEGPASEAALNNIFMLLESCRNNMFFAFNKNVHQHALPGGESLTINQPTQSHLEDVNAAVNNSIASTFGGEQPDDAISAIEEALRRVAYPDRFGAPQEPQLAKAVQFFDALQNNLKTV